MKRILLYLVLSVCVLWVVGTIFFPPPSYGARSFARLSSCRSNLRQIGLGLLQYAQDYDERLPPARVTSSTGWADVVQPYVKSRQFFQCPAAAQASPSFTSDYFYNRNLARIAQDKITIQNTTILAGDGTDNAPPWASLTRLPTDAAVNPDSPARRHIDMGNYLFVDGHVRAFAPLNLKTMWWRAEQ